MEKKSQQKKKAEKAANQKKCAKQTKKKGGSFHAMQKKKKTPWKSTKLYSQRKKKNAIVRKVDCPLCQPAVARLTGTGCLRPSRTPLGALWSRVTLSV